MSIMIVILLTVTPMYISSLFFINDTATPSIYTYCHTLSLHDALPIYLLGHVPFGIERRLLEQIGSIGQEAGGIIGNDVHSQRSGLGHTDDRSEEHTSELKSLMRISYAVFCLNKKKHRQPTHDTK